MNNTGKVRSSKPQRFIHREAGEVYTLTMGEKRNADNELKPVYQLRSDLHYFECDTWTELQKNFIKL